MSAGVETYRFSVEEFNKLGQAGIFDEDDRVELLDGEIIVMSPIGSEHAAAVLRLNWYFQQRLGQHLLTSVQSPAVVDEFSEPQPDLMLLKPKSDFYKAEHPRPEDIILLVEVSDSTLAFDRGRKLPKYAESAVSEVWIVNLQNQTIEQYRAPSASEYARSQIFRRGEMITIEKFPEVSFAVEELIA